MLLIPGKYLTLLSLVCQFFSLPISRSSRYNASLFPYREELGLPRMSTEHGITKFNKTRNKPSYQGSKEQAKELEIPSFSLLVIPQKTPS